MATRVQPLPVSTSVEERLKNLVSKIAHNPSVTKDVELSIADSANGRLVSVKELEKRLKK
jgi:hypothetical protein